MAHRADGLNDIFEHDVTVRDKLKTTAGTIETTPTANKDIVNKEYVDSQITAINSFIKLDGSNDNLISATIDFPLGASFALEPLSQEMIWYVSADTNTGMSYFGADTLGIRTGGDDRAVFDNTGLTTIYSIFLDSSSAQQLILKNTAAATSGNNKSPPKLLIDGNFFLSSASRDFTVTDELIISSAEATKVLYKKGFTSSGTGSGFFGMSRPLSLSAFSPVNFIMSSDGTYVATPYDFSIQSNQTTTYIEILNSTGTGKGGFFGVNSNDFELWNYQGNAAGSGAFPTVFYGGFASVELARFDRSAGTVFNETALDIDFRIESDTNANMFFVDAGNNRVGIGLNNPAYTLDVNGDLNIPSASAFRVGGTAGVSGSFTTADLKTVTVTKGIITAIV